MRTAWRTTIILVLALLALAGITACAQTNVPDTGLNDAPPVMENEGPGELPPEPAPSEEQDVPEYPWMAPETEPLSYEEFFAEEREYDYIWSSFWSFDEEGDSYTAYKLNSDENGFFICKYSDRKNPIHRIPNSETLLDCDKVLTDTRKLYCIKGGDLLRVDVLTGQTDLLYSAEAIPDMVGGGDVLHFLSLSDGVLLLNRLYLPTATLDLLYAQPAPDVPASFYELRGAATNRSTIYWETVSPIFWEKILPILNGEDDNCPELWYSYCFALEYMTEHPQPLSDEGVQHNFAMLQDHFNLRPRMEGCYDPVADTYTQQYGIFDICFFGTGIHSHDEHFADHFTKD